MKKFIKDILTGKDGVTYDVARVALVVTLTVFLGLAVKNYKKFDPLAFGGGVGALIAGTGVAVSVKAKTEPEAPSSQGAA